MADILGIGIAVLDIVCEVDGYPAEDDEVRALSRSRRRGGNTGNTLTVLAGLGHRCEFAGTLTDDGDGRFVRERLTATGIGSEYCRVYREGAMPTSYIWLNRRNGSRTIVHHRDLPEFAAADFAAVPGERFGWLHVEGRNVAETARILGSLRQHGFRGRISVEIEKPRPDIEQLFPLADILIFSRHFARHRGYDDGERFLARVRADGTEADLVCAWGEQGAFGLDRDGVAHFAPSCPPPRLVDTLGAGDVFNAGLIHGLVTGQPLPRAMALACALAGHKCGRVGLEGLQLPETVS